MQVMDRKPEEKELLTVEDLASLLGKSEYTIKKFLRDGVLPRGFKIKETWYLKREDWQTFLREQQEKN